jgi:ferredoxin
MFETVEPMGKAEVRQELQSMGADLIGFVEVRYLDEVAPPESRPSTIARPMNTLVVFAKRSLIGVAWSRHAPSKQLAGGRTLRVLDHIASRLAYSLEARGYPSLPIATGVFDFERRIPEDVTPAGQGSYLLRLAAVEAGLGTWGLNMMVLTRAYGPRIYLGGVMTQLKLEGDRPLGTELCHGLEKCGRCAAICPEDAIPRSASVGAELGVYRGIDRTACCRSSQPFGFNAFVDHVADILQTLDGKEMWTRMRSRKTGEMWSEMAMVKEASITGCSECTQVCPVGEDYEEIQKSPLRRQDLPENLPVSYSGGMVQIAHIGPQIRRKTTW